MITRRIYPNFSEKHKEYIARAKEATVSVAEGAVRAGKTIDNVLVFAEMLNNGTPDRFHLATGSTSGNAKLNIAECNGFGLEHIFRGRCRWTKYDGNDALKIRLHGRTYYVIFAGAGKADSFKKIQGNSYGMWIATEVNLSHESMIKTAFSRQLAARNRKILWDLNPTSPGAWIYKDYIDKFPEQFGDKYVYERFRIRDNATITEERFEEIESQYEPGTIWYRRDILGERCQAEGLVYPMFGEDNLVHEYLWDIPAEEREAYLCGEKYYNNKEINVGEWYLSIDYGTMNPTVIGLWRVHNGIATMEDEYYYDGRHSMKQKTDEDYYSDLELFAGRAPIEKIIIDPSAASFKATIHKHGKYSTRDANNSVLDGIRVTGTLLGEGKIKIHDTCKKTIEEFGLYSWDESKDEDTVIKENDHSMDAMRYLVMAVKNKLVRRTYSPVFMR